jgi:putative phosphonate catabolism associated alcohol dehydrogenase
MSEPVPPFAPGRAAIFKGHGQPFEHIIRDVSPVKPGEILVRNLYTTLCGSDIHTYCGRRLEPAQVVLGHEIVGEIVWIDPAHSGKDLRGVSLKAGDRITWSIFAVQPKTPAPRADIPQKSAHLFKYGHAFAKGNEVFNGGLADYCLLLPHTAIIKISEQIPLKVAATINCAHATVSGALRVAGDLSGKKILIFGMGLLGISCVAMCKEAGASWIGVVDKEPDRMAWSKEFGGNDAFALPESDHGLPWPFADVVFDMTGDPRAMEMGLDSLEVGGVAVWIGAVYPANAVHVDAEKIVRKVAQIRGLHNYNYEDFLNATIFIESNYKKYPFEDLIEKEYSLSEIQIAFEFANAHKPVRVGIPLQEDN